MYHEGGKTYISALDVGKLVSCILQAFAAATCKEETLYHILQRRITM